jgi:Flp pilus assembly pilin Flp
MRKTPILLRFERGTAAVEFALIAIFFFTLIFGIVELGRLLYLWNTVQEVTRHAAREAVVRNFVTDTDAVRREAMFRGGAVAETVHLPAGPEISNAEVSITYLYDTDPAHVVSPAPADPADNISACADAARTNSCIRYVRAEVCTPEGCGRYRLRYSHPDFSGCDACGEYGVFAVIGHFVSMISNET